MKFLYIIIKNQMSKKDLIIKTKLCELCSEPFEVDINHKNSSKKRFCSGFCAKRNNGLNNKGKRRTEEYKEQLSKKLKGDGNPFYGKKHTEESILKMKKSSEWKNCKFRICTLTPAEKEIFEGIIISDGYLNSCRTSTRLSLGFKYKETLERIYNDLQSIQFDKIKKYESKPHKKTNKKYISYHMRSLPYFNFLDFRKKWYKNNKKTIPEDLDITPLFGYYLSILSIIHYF
jgi:hypothetical protein